MFLARRDVSDSPKRRLPNSASDISIDHQSPIDRAIARSGNRRFKTRPFTMAFFSS